MENSYFFYKDFSEDQFVEDNYFQQWINYPDKQADEFWNHYLQMYPHQQQAINIARLKVEAALRPSQHQPLSLEEKSQLKNSIYQQIKQSPETLYPLKSKRLQLLKYAAAAAVILIVSVPIVNRSSKKKTLISIHTDFKETKEILLADSTLVILNGNSSISYNPAIAAMPNREIFLQGNAYFNVKKKTDHQPFTVHANAVSITVLGTQFNVNARSSATNIVLKSGSVKVSSDSTNIQPVFMQPGEMVQLDSLHQSFIKSTANASLYAAWTEGVWHFSDVPLYDVTNLIYEYYGVKSIYADEKAKQFKISAVIPVTDLASFIQILSKTLDIKITAQNNDLHIKI